MLKHDRVGMGHTSGIDLAVKLTVSWLLSCSPASQICYESEMGRDECYMGLLGDSEGCTYNTVRAISSFSYFPFDYFKLIALLV